LRPEVRILRIQLTGRVAVHDTGSGADLPGRQGRLVLASLAATGHPVARETLAERIWGDRLPRAWERDLSAIVSRLRSALGGPGLVVAEHGAYRLALPADAEVDLRRARAAAAEAGTALATGDPAGALALAEEVTAVADRPFLPGEEADWISAVREELRELRLRALGTSADALAALGRTADALRVAAGIVESDPFLEPAHRRIMRLHLADGDRASAVRAYERCRRALADQLGVDPAPETEALYLEALRATGAAGPAPPPVRYARSGLVNIAWQTVGDGPVDLVFVPGWVSNLEMSWQEPRLAGFLRRLASMSRLILFDKRGTGLSDPVPIDDPPPLAVRMDDVRAVMDAAGSERAVLFGFSEGGSLALLFAATYPDRVAGLVLWGAWAYGKRTDDHPWGWTREENMRRLVRPIQQHGAVSPRWFAPTAAGDPAFDAWFARWARQSASPGMAIALLKANAATDVRPLLPSIPAPALVLHRTGDTLVDVGQGRYLGRSLPKARYAELPGTDHWPWVGDSEPVLAEIAGFLRDPDGQPDEPDLLLTTILAVAGHPDAAALVERAGGTVLGPAAELLLARFDTPGRAVRCAAALAGRPGARAGLHTGEARRGSELTSAAADLARGAAAVAGLGQVVVTRPVADLVAGSGLRFAELGERALPPAPGRWALFALEPGQPG
jgi:pimeloyl-ACP methyl ester carboxylesterase/DNA-binding SARP family transcriptional activator